MLRSYNTFGMCTADGEEITASLFCFSEDGLMYKVLKRDKKKSPVRFIATVACDLQPGVRPMFKIGFLDNPVGAKEAAKSIGLAQYLRDCSDELRKLAFATV